MCSSFHGAKMFCILYPEKINVSCVKTTASMQGCAMCSSFHGAKMYWMHQYAVCKDVQYTLYSARELLCNVQYALFSGV